MSTTDENVTSNTKQFEPKHLKLEVIWVQNGQVRLVHQVADDEAYLNGYTGAELTLYFNDARDDGPLTVGDLVQIALKTDAY